MPARIELTPTGYKEYPYGAKVFMRPEDFVDVTAIPAETLPQDTTHILLDLYKGDGQTTKFYESLTPVKPIRDAKGDVQMLPHNTIGPEEYLDLLRRNGIATPPEQWIDSQAIFVRQRGFLTVVQMPSSSDDLQARVVNTTRQNLAVDSADVTSLRSARQYVRRIEQAGFPRAAFKDLIIGGSLGIETASRVILNLGRSIGKLQPPPDGQLRAVIRTENSRPDVQRRR